MNDTELATMTELELYAELGRQLSPSASFGGDDLAFLAGRGKAWFDQHLDQLRGQVCGHVKATGDILVDASAIAAALSEALHELTAVLVVAFLIAKQGLTVFCRGHEN
jgi:hypothetical protein